MSRAPNSALLTSLRLYGDVVLMVPLIDMIRQDHPQCAIDMVVPKGAADLVRHDPRVRRVFEQQRGRSGYMLKTLLRTDWALTQNSSDRSVLSVAFAGRRRRFAAGTGPARPREFWKRLLLTDIAPVRGGKPVIKWCVTLAQAAGIEPRRCEARLFWSTADEIAVSKLLDPSGGAERCFVLHGFSRYPYKEWPMERWITVSDAIAKRHGLQPVWTGAPSDAERMREVAQHAVVQPVQAAGVLGLAAISCLLSRARLYLGVDTAVTHMAAACNVPIVALYGPTPIRGWAPWNNFAPVEYDFPYDGGSFRNGHISTLQDRWTHERDLAAEPLDMQRPTASMAAISIDEVLAEAEHVLALPDLRVMAGAPRGG
ncbi:MAG: glycosyltransferase family 9 protein [Planctomycetes bacterium]|nr:glycosyltransferase family 9 protein [Planctomycetota bacterium]